jgi:dimethylhistidine N-methyltransferase
MYKPGPDEIGDLAPDIAAFHDMAPDMLDFHEAVIKGLSGARKAIPCRFLYDERGSQLFDQICELPEYYPTRTEIGILRRIAPAIARIAGSGAQLIELGSGSSAKVGILLDALDRPHSYVPIDISREHLRAAARRIQAVYPRLRVEAVCADFGQSFDLPAMHGEGRRIGFYPGSTIGNLEPAEAVAFLGGWADRLGRGALMIVGVDLRKDRAILEPAYDDAQGVTAAFSLNVLERANRELGSDFMLEGFRHRALYDAGTGRMGIDLISLANQSVTLDGRRFDFAQGEPLHIENSWKYSIDGFQTMARRAGFSPVQVWTDGHALFSVHLLEVAAPAR